MALVSIERLEERTQHFIDEQNYYAALQVYFTYHPRLKAQKKYAEWADFLYRGGIKMIQAGEFANALKIGEMFIDTLTVSKTPVSKDLVDQFYELYQHLTADAELLDESIRLLNSARKWAGDNAYARSVWAGFVFDTELD